jgi:DNA-binding MarR family transcriptional regulator
MTISPGFDLKDFTPYMLAMAAEAASAGFQQFYKSRYGMLRTEWRVLFHLGRYGAMTAKDICDRARIHKTKVSRAVAALEEKRFLTRQKKDDDRRHEELRLTRQGQAAFDVLYVEARRFDAEMMGVFSEAERDILRRCLLKIAGL